MQLRHLHEMAVAEAGDALGVEQAHGRLAGQLVPFHAQRLAVAMEAQPDIDPAAALEQIGLVFAGRPAARRDHYGVSTRH